VSFWIGKLMVAPPSYVVHVRQQFSFAPPRTDSFHQHVLFLSGKTEGTERVEILDHVVQLYSLVALT
jgi:hypothetical protein